MTKKNILLIIIALLLISGLTYVISVNEPETPAPQGKLDINAVCEGALAYMSFTDGASAETYVAECKEGKHPEVIEKYIQDQNLDGATI